MGIGVVWAAAVLSVVLCGAGDLGGEFVCEPAVAEVFPVWAGGVGVAVADLLEEAAYAESGDFFQRWRGRSASVKVEDRSLRDAKCASGTKKSAPKEGAPLQDTAEAQPLLEVRNGGHSNQTWRFRR